jgi:hypothetical protein
VSSNEAALPEYVFGPWVAAERGENPLPIGVDYENQKLPGRVFVNSNTPFEKVATIRRAYRIGEWHSHDGGPLPVPVDARYQYRYRGSDTTFGPFIRTMARSKVDSEGVTSFRVLAPLGRSSDQLYIELFDLLRFGVDANKAEKAVDAIFERIRSCNAVEGAYSVIRDLIDAILFRDDDERHEAADRAQKFLGESVA